MELRYYVVSAVLLMLFMSLLGRVICDIFIVLSCLFGLFVDVVNVVVR